MIGRRALLRAGVAGLAGIGGWLAGWPRGARADHHAATGSAPAPGLAPALESSPFVYVSPLRSDGAESTCHAEVWYAWLDGHVVLITGAERWKARSVRRGLDRARIWVGDHGRWKGLLGANERFRQGPSFEARAAFSRDEALLERMLASFERKYPDEIASWRDRMRSGFHDGSRVLLRYRPAPPAS